MGKVKFHQPPVTHSLHLAPNEIKLNKLKPAARHIYPPHLHWRSCQAITAANEFEPPLVYGLPQLFHGEPAPIFSLNTDKTIHKSTKIKKTTATQFFLLNVDNFGSR